MARDKSSGEHYPAPGVCAAPFTELRTGSAAASAPRLSEAGLFAGLAQRPRLVGEDGGAPTLHPETPEGRRAHAASQGWG